RDAQEKVGTALIELQVEPSAGDLGLEQAVAWRERHAVDFPRIPGRDDLAPRTGVLRDQFDQVPDLVDVAAVGRFPVAPLLAVNRAEVTMLVGPFIPDADLALI